MGWGNQQPKAVGRFYMPGDPKDIRVEGFLGSVVIKCACGAPRAIIVPVASNGPGAAECDACKVIWSVKQLHYVLAERAAEGEEQQPTTFKVEFAGLFPNLVTPH